VISFRGTQPSPASREQASVSRCPALVPVTFTLCQADRPVDLARPTGGHAAQPCNVLQQWHPGAQGLSHQPHPASSLSPSCSNFLDAFLHARLSNAFVTPCAPWRQRVVWPSAVAWPILLYCWCLYCWCRHSSHPARRRRLRWARPAAAVGLPAEGRRQRLPAASVWRSRQQLNSSNSGVHVPGESSWGPCARWAGRLSWGCYTIAAGAAGHGAQQCIKLHMLPAFHDIRNLRDLLAVLACLSLVFCMWCSWW